MDRKTKPPRTITLTIDDLYELLEWAKQVSKDEHGKQLEMEFDVDILPSPESVPAATESTILETSTDTTTTATTSGQIYSGFARNAIRQPTNGTGRK